MHQLPSLLVYRYLHPKQCNGHVQQIEDVYLLIPVQVSNSSVLFSAIASERAQLSEYLLHHIETKGQQLSAATTTLVDSKHVIPTDYVLRPSHITNLSVPVNCVMPGQHCSYQQDEALKCHIT
jgi:hypothetical protein